METEREPDVKPHSSACSHDPAKPIPSIEDSAALVGTGKSEETGTENPKKDQMNEKLADNDPNKGMAEKDRDDQTYDDDRGRLRYERLAGHFGILTPLEGRRKKAKIRMIQSMQYGELIEDRILDLEKKVRKALHEKTPPLDEENASEAVPGSHNCYKVLSWADFSARFEVDRKQRLEGRWQHRPEMDDKPKNVIELLLEEPRFSYAALVFKGSQSDSRLPVEITSQLKGQDAKPVALEPHRIRIRSPYLLTALKSITGCATTIGPYEHRLTLMRPFKLLVVFADKVQKHFADLEREHARSCLGMFPVLPIIDDPV
jgi:hypothetical protein